VLIALIGAWIYRWVDEDAFINFRIIDNLLAGHGLVFNVGERVEVDSDPLWLFTLTALHEILPFLAVEWLSVLLGLFFTVVGFLSGGRAIQQLAFSRQETHVFPIGLLIVSVVAGVWEFSTSGLEMSMVFAWLGISFLMLVGVERSRSRPLPAAAVMGLGTLIRPELALGSLVFLAALLVIIASSKSNWSGPPSWWLRFGAPVLVFIALPLAYEIFRMGYYALVIPNTGLAKAGGAAWWSQGLTYLWNFVAPYALWLPLALAVPFLWLPVRAWWKKGDRLGVIVLCTPLAIAVADVVYVVHLGGDYMHARLLLPGFFALGLPLFATARQLRTTLVVPLVGIALWSVVCAGWLRFVPPKLTSLNPQSIYISNERNNWISATGNDHPITAADYKKALSGSVGALLNYTARQVPHGEQKMLIVTDPYAPLKASTAQTAHSSLPFTLTVNVPAIGVIGYLAGPNVYIFDSYSLANPIGSHTVIVRHSRPGHEKYIGPAWMVARFGSLSHDARLTSAPNLSSKDVAAARRALGCNPLASYLHAITAPLGASQFMSNFGHALRFTTMSFSANPQQAEVELCGSGSPHAAAAAAAAATATPTATPSPTPSPSHTASTNK